MRQKYVELGHVHVFAQHRHMEMEKVTVYAEKYAFGRYANNAVIACSRKTGMPIICMYVVSFDGCGNNINTL